jgi:hypothetical protein
LQENAEKDGSEMRDDRLPDHSRLVYVVIGIVLLIVAIPLILLLILHVLASDVMHYRVTAERLTLQIEKGRVLCVHGCLLVKGSETDESDPASNAYDLLVDSGRSRHCAE